MIKDQLTKINPVRTLLLTFVIVSIGILVVWDRNEVNRDFDNVMALLREVWITAGVNDRTIVVRFEEDKITATDDDSGLPFSTLNVSTLHQVNYDTTLGSNMIVFSGVGTSIHNKREHGGDLILKSWFGFNKYIAVNCAGLATEGRYPA